jgi:hypothetical protein
MMPVMVSQPSEAKTDQRDKTNDEQGAGYLQRHSCPAIHVRCHRDTGSCHQFS